MMDFYDDFGEFDPSDINLDDVELVSDHDDEFDTVVYDEEEIYGSSNKSISDTITDTIDLNQLMLLSYLRANYELWIRCVPILDVKYFSNDLKPVFDMLKDFEKRNQQLPHKSVVLADTGISLHEPEDASDPIISIEISNRIEEFCRHQAAENFLLDAAEILDTDKSRGTLAHMVKEMERISQISVVQDLGYEVHEDIVKLLEKAELSDALPTGFELLDEALNGGVTNPSYNIISAASGQGKSIYLQNQAVNYSRMGYNVVYITLELPEFMIEKRFAAMMTNTNINELYKNLDFVISNVKKAKNREGKIQIKRMPMFGVTVADIRAYVNELTASTGLEWNHIMIDYPDLMSPMMPGIRADNIHLKDQAISVELYEWTHDPRLTKTIWGASQQVKGAKDEKDAKQSGVSGGVGKVHTCDNLIIMKRTWEDIQDEQCWAHIEKGRNGGQGMRIPFRWDSQSQRMSTPEDNRSLMIEANGPNSKSKSDKDTKPSRVNNDPIYRATENAKNPAAQKASALAERIGKRIKGT